MGMPPATQGKLDAEQVVAFDGLSGISPDFWQAQEEPTLII